MPKGKMVIFTAPASAEKEGEFNRWYNEVHIPEITAAAPKVSGATRYKVSAIPSQWTPPQPYMAMYHLADTADGIAQMMAGGAGYTATDSSSPTEGGVPTSVVYEQIFEFNKK